MNYLQVEFSFLQKNEKDILIALLIEASFESFEEDENSLKAFIKEKEFDETLLANIIKKVPVNYLTSVIPQQNWNAQWESSFEPIIINNFAGIRAGFHQPLKNVSYQIIITPKMSFGTGHHQTTHLMLSAQMKMDHRGKRVMDAGCGTAILSVMASKLGATEVEAFDIDEWSVENGNENAANNNCNNIHIQLGKINEVNLTGTFDIILANINKNILLMEMKQYASYLKTNGQLLLSGFYVKDISDLQAEAARYGFANVSFQERETWACLLLQKQ